MTIRTAGLLLASLLYGSVAGAQTNSELLQKAIYTQDTVGDVAAAVRMYQQVIANTPPASDLRTQAVWRLAVAKEQQQLARSGANPEAAHSLATGSPLGTFDGRTYRHSWSAMTFAVPEGWKLNATVPSSDNGEMAIFYSKDLGAEIQVWMIKEKTPRDKVNTRLDNAPVLKLQSRTTEFEDYRFREGSIQRVFVGGQQAVVAVADFVSGDAKAPMAEYMTWIYTENSRVFFFSRLPADKLDALKPEFDMMVSSAIVP
jgi:hypothetical protein